jgi:hypothetical protein
MKTLKLDFINAKSYIIGLPPPPCHSFIVGKLDVGLNTSLTQLICRQEPKHLNFSAQK